MSIKGDLGMLQAFGVGILGLFVTFVIIIAVVLFAIIATPIFIGLYLLIFIWAVAVVIGRTVVDNIIWNKGKHLMCGGDWKQAENDQNRYQCSKCGKYYQAKRGVQ
jgi:hypothetical protein